MSLALKKTGAASGSSARTQKDIGASRLPQVNLLPTDVTEARSLKKLKIVLLAAVVVVLLAIGGVTVLAMGQVSRAQDRVDAENVETARLQTEQRKYAEVPVVLGKISDTEKALFRAGMGDIQWVALLDAITVQLPQDTELRKVVIEGWEAALGSVSLNDPSQSSVLHARVSLDFVSKAKPDASELLAALEALPTIESARLAVAETIEGDGNDLFYSTIASVTVNLRALSGTTFPKEMR
ncbi:hypothetical protein ACTVCO_09290 [Sanguibacter sp. A247]|uniref:hypothetical protein n=1 Tax=unclassified Sanguibacter TaxID=2645534 RepID=UPI003FD8E636